MDAATSSDANGGPTLGNGKSNGQALAVNQHSGPALAVNQHSGPNLDVRNGGRKDGISLNLSENESDISHV